MIALLPFAILILTALSIFVLSQFRSNIGRIWLVTALFSLINFSLIIVIHWFLPRSIEFENWFPVSNLFTNGFLFQLDEVSWSFLLALGGLNLSIILTDSASLDEIREPTIWISNLLIIAVGFLAVLAGNILTIFFSWTIMDLAELFILLKNVSGFKKINETIISFSVRLGGLFFLILAMIILRSQGEELIFGMVTGWAGIMVLLAISLRLGVLPFNLPFGTEVVLRRGLGNAIRMTSVASSLIVLIRLPVNLTVSGNFSWLVTIILLASLLSAILWTISKNSLEGRPFWIITMSGLTIFSIITGNVMAGISWGIAMLLTGSILFLSSVQSKATLFIPAIAFISFLGFPFTPLSLGWEKILTGGNPGWTVIVSVSLFFLIVGFLKFSLQKRANLLEKERWIWVIYPLGLFFILITQWIIYLLSNFEWRGIGLIWPSSVITMVLLSFYLLKNKIRFWENYSDWFSISLDRFRKITINVLQLDWFYKFIWAILGWIQRIINLFSNVLEGRSGILWVYVLLALLLSVLSSTGAL